MENEGLRDANDAQILEFLRKEKEADREKVRDEERAKKTVTPIKGYDRPRNILYGNEEPKPKTLEETWRNEDEQIRQYNGEKEYKELCKQKKVR